MKAHITGVYCEHCHHNSIRMTVELLSDDNKVLSKHYICIQCIEFYQKLVRDSNKKEGVK